MTRPLIDRLTFNLNELLTLTTLTTFLTKNVVTTTATVSFLPQ